MAESSPEKEHIERCEACDGYGVLDQLEPCPADCPKSREVMAGLRGPSYIDEATSPEAAAAVHRILNVGATENDHMPYVLGNRVRDLLAEVICYEKHHQREPQGACPNCRSRATTIHAPYVIPALLAVVTSPVRGGR